MSVVDIILIAVALSMDACALTVANCTTYGKNLTRAKSLSMPIAFGVFQGVMPLIGYFVGSTFAGYLSGISKYLVAGVFFVLTGKIIFDIIKEMRGKNKDEDTEKPKSKFTVWVLLIQAVATSIDALFIGVTMAIEGVSISVFWAVLIIAAITFALALLCLLLGKALGKVLGKYADWAGALILFALAFKNLIEAIIASIG